METKEPTLREMVDTLEQCGLAYGRADVEDATTLNAYKQAYDALIRRIVDADPNGTHSPLIRAIESLGETCFGYAAIESDHPEYLDSAGRERAEAKQKILDAIAP